MATGGTPGERFQLTRSAFGVSRQGEYPNMYAVYILELRPGEDGIPKFYIGFSACLSKRIQDHMLGNENSVDWVRRFGVQRVVDTIKTTSDSCLVLEAAVTSQYKTLCGWANVRGSCDNRSDDLSSGMPRFWSAPEDGTVRSDVNVEA